ncbi:hypothetical protein SDC9_108379 [bioreactor metagenome]|uniref:Uncharacterized protein n=1 Tax=bioreactor metagenome TaxID=1076179 RepID=A0A645B7S0_9ZZZZ
MPNVPNTTNHIIHTMAGTMVTPIINSLIVLPLDILAMNIPTNGIHAIHKAQ